MNYTKDELTIKRIPAIYAATAAKFIAAENQMNIHLVFTPIAKYGTKLLTVEEINKLTNEIFALSKR